MSDVAQRYRELLDDLILVRRLADGDLPQEIEARFVNALYRCWQQMSDEEQEREEKRLAEMDG